MYMIFPVLGCPYLIACLNLLLAVDWQVILLRTIEIDPIVL
jgi:hypothetical protein